MALFKGGYYPKCPRTGCFANRDGYCGCLKSEYSETNMECPFFKWRAQMVEERKKYPWTDYSNMGKFRGKDVDYSGN